jgi:signal transduction histidine kinase/DNA-binding response OmpR family regulator
VVDKPYTYTIDTLQNFYFDIGLQKLWIAMDSTETWTIETASAAETQSQYMFKLDYQKQYGELNPYTTYWGKIHLKNTLTTNITGILEVSPKNSFVDVFIRQTDGSFSHQRTGQYVPVAERAIRANVGNSVWVDLPAGETQEVYIKIKRITGFVPRFGISLSTPEYWIHQRMSFNDIVAGFITGAIAIMAFFFLFYFITTKDRTYLYYSLFLFLVALYYLFDYQYYYADALLGQYIHLKLYVWLLTSIYAVFLVQFARSFLNLPKRFPYLDRVFQLMIAARLILLATAIGILAWNYDFDLADRVYSMGYNNVEVPLWLVFCVYLAWKCRNWADRIMLLGIGIFMLCFGFVLLSFQRPELFDYQQLIPYSYNIGFTAQVICLSVALGIRQRNSQREESSRLEKKVQERTEQIIEQTVELRKLSQFRSRLLANVSHEFRTPLTLIINPLSRLIREQGEGSSSASLFVQMKSHAESLLQLVDQLLILSRIESDTFILDRTRADIVEYLRPALSLFYGQAERQQINYQISLPDQPVVVHADLAKINIIVNNLLSNAFKFTPEGGSVTISLHCWENILQISVQDSGVGIAPHEQNVIFDRFYQSENGKKRDVSGTGIGLSLTQELVQLHEGTIQVESQPDQGATFTVLLPVVVPEEEPQPLVKTHAPDIPVPILMPHPEVKLISPDAPRVLVVEDNVYMQQHLQECLQNHFWLTIAPDGKKGQELAETEMPDLIVTDLAMPQQDGLQLTQALKSNLLTSHIPVIMLTAWADPEHQMSGWQHGADAYMTKPFDEYMLRARISNLLEERNRLRDYYRQHLFQNSESLAAKSAQNRNDLPTDPFLEKLKEVMEAQYANSNLDVELLGREVALSSSHLNRKLKALIGKSTNEFIRSYRLQKAAELLMSESYDIAEVAYKTGFASPSYFTQRFSKHFGYTPSEYQKKVKDEA